MGTQLAASPGTGPGTAPITQVGTGGTRAGAPVAGLASDESDGVVRTLGVHYGARVRPGDRFSPVGDPLPGLLQSAPAVFPQTPGGLDWLLGPALSELPQSEDAFQLNIWAPVGAAGAPVLVFLPGGAFVSGAGTVRWYDGGRLAREGGAVVVTVNYRLGALALAGDAESGRNLPMGDLLQALRWVRANIAAFGGDPGNTTLAGQSAGAFYAFALSQLPEAAGLFRRTALHSLAFQPPLGQAADAERRAILERELCGTPLAEAPVEQVLAAQAAVNRAYAGRGLGIMPVADRSVPADLFDVRAAAGRLHVSEILLTATQDEAAAFLKQLPVEAVGEEQLAGFVAGHFEDAPGTLARLAEALPGSTPHARLVEAMTLHQFRLYAEELADAATDAGTAATTARFAFRAGLPGAGSAHCFDLPFLFGNPGQWADSPMLGGLDPVEFEAVSAEFRSLLTGFAADGRPRRADGSPLPRRGTTPGLVHAIDGAGAASRPADPGFACRR